jgi:hypothetical protein
MRLTQTSLAFVARKTRRLFSAQRKPSGPDQASGTPITAHPRFKINNVADRFRGATQTGR